MEEFLILFDKEIEKLKATKWKYKTLYSKNGIYGVKVNLPNKVAEKLR